MTPGPPRGEFERRLDELREEAERAGRVEGAPARVVGGPVPTAGAPALAPARSSGASPAGYYGQPLLKPPVWTWEVPLYFWVGGAAGMAAVLALASLMLQESVLLTRGALRLAAAGALVSPLLLTLDLGRPSRFHHMLRVFKWRSPMSVGAWTLVAFGLLAVPAWLTVELYDRLLLAGLPAALLGGLLRGLVVGAGALGALLAVYTGVLLAATVVPAWASHPSLLPLHFGVAGLGTAAALLEVAGFRHSGLWWLGLAAAALETAAGAWVELRGAGVRDRALREGRAGALLRGAGLFTGPLSLLLRLLGWVPAAAVSFALGSLVNRYGWVAAGRASALDPEAALAD